MTISSTKSPTDNQTEQIMDSLKSEIDSLKSKLKRRDDRIASLEVMLNQLTDGHSTEVRAFEDLEGKLEDVIEMLRKRVPHCDILDYLKVKDSNEFQFRNLW
ncbi:MAG: hypothetical protein FJ123_00075 [Deltaproteobacteria bacterium]|nr:hypothetical protein [Deltaproteobacteria bacterium]